MVTGIEIWLWTSRHCKNSWMVAIDHRSKVQPPRLGQKGLGQGTESKYQAVMIGYTNINNNWLVVGGTWNYHSFGHRGVYSRSRSESATKGSESATMSRQPKKGWVGNQNESESTTKSADSATLSRQLRKRWVGNQKSAESATKNRSPLK